MRTINYIVLFACLLLGLSACHKNQDVRATTPGTADFTMQTVTGALKIAFMKDPVTPGYMEILNEEEDQKLRLYLAAGYPETKGKIIKLLNFNITGTGTRRYLMFEGYDGDTKRNRTFAYPIALNEDGTMATFSVPGMNINGRLVAAADGESHSCTGNPCSCCRFLYSGSTIIGCDCLLITTCLPRGTCNHSVSGGGGGGTVPAFGQCGGEGWEGATSCVAGYICQLVNPYYSQCVPPTARM